MPTPPFTKVLVANRGEIAVRIIRTLDRLGVASVAVHSEADRSALHVRLAGEAVALGAGPASDSYLRADAVIDAALSTGAEAVHPGYGFLSESSTFASAVEDAGLVFLGPTPEQIRLFGDKHQARRAAELAGVPVLVGSGLLDGPEAAQEAAARVGFPVMLKSAAGGGGIGMTICEDAAALDASFDQVRRMARASFGSDAVYLERFVARARHVEVQIFGDGADAVVALGDRDCSAQRRNQKVIEEAPAPDLTDATRQLLTDAALALARSVSYRSAGTVEFIVDAVGEQVAFLEVNTRLQVEHAVTEAVCGIDLVEWMVRIGAGDRSPLEHFSFLPTGHAFEARIYAEDPARGFRPSTGRLTEVLVPEGVRWDGWIERGTEVTPFYDPLLAKVIVHGDDRDDAVARLNDALDATSVAGIETNLGLLRQVASSDELRAAALVTTTLAGLDVVAPTIEVIEAGNLSTIQDLPGRLGYWAVGVPPSGPIDPLSFRIGNRIVGNREGAPALELTVRGPVLRFAVPTVVALTGAVMSARLDGEPVPWWMPISIDAGQELAVGELEAAGCRAYLSVRGGFDVPDYLGSASTFTLGGFGGHAGRALRAGDVLHLVGEGASVSPPIAPPPGIVPTMSRTWQIGVMAGPHGAPDYLTDEDLDDFYEARWEVHYNSARTGIRLTGPRPRWARPDGGEAGLHPSNINDNAYAIGTVDFTGDMPIILGPDGPSLGGFVCPATTVQAELWKLGQLRAGDTVQFVPWTAAQAALAERRQDDAVAAIGAAATAESGAAEPVAAERVVPSPPYAPAELDGVLRRVDATDAGPAVTYRQAGDRHLLVEFGPDVLDLDLRFRVHSLMKRLEDERLSGVIDLTPGIRSLQIHFDSRRRSLAEVLDMVAATEAELPSVDEMEVPTRIVHLPLSWDDPSTIEATARYMQVVRPDAPWCPHNLEFIRRVNGLDSIDDVYRTVFDASYLVLGLGDVYLGAPVATPLDPRHRLVTTKYNPARTWTPENAVGIGGAYLCIYGMEGPGGYQFVGRTVPVWNTWHTTRHFTAGSPWLLRFFDQIRFYPVSAEELMELRRDLLVDRAALAVEEHTFRLADYHRFLAEIEPETARFRARQRAAFDAERAAWAASGELDRANLLAEEVAPPRADDEVEAPPGGRLVGSPLGASVWQVAVAPGARVVAGDVLVVLEAMKTETEVRADGPGVVTEVLVKPGHVVAAGQPLVVLGPA